MASGLKSAQVSIELKGGSVRSAMWINSDIFLLVKVTQVEFLRRFSIVAVLQSDLIHWRHVIDYKSHSC